MDQPHASEGPAPAAAPRPLAATVVPDASAPAPLAEIHRLGPYVLVRLIASGGMGAVWEAIDSRLGRRVAVKVMLREGANADERFQREALHAAKLHHPNIVAVHDVGSDRGRPYLVMDLIEGPTLDDALRERPTTWREKADIVEVIARAVQYAHEQGVVHRDLKPANVLLKRDPRATRAVRRGSSSGTMVARTLGEPLVMDFGLAKDVAQDSGLSRDGQAMGTPAYMPPEQAEGRLEQIGPRSDVYGLGAILYETLTGRAPFAGESPARIMRAVVEDEPAAPGSVVTGVPRDLETICLRCLEKHPAKRYASAGAVADDLAAWLAGDPIAARRSSWLERAAKRVSKNPAAWTATFTAAAMLVAAIVGAVVFLDMRRSEAVAHASEMDRLVARMKDEETRREAAEIERARLERERRREWQPVFSDRFDSDDLAQRWDVVSTGGAAEVRGGALHIVGGRPQIASPRGRFAGDVRLSFTCRAASRVSSDISCFLAASGFAHAREDRLDGYICQYGGRGNTVQALLRDNDAVLVSRRDGAIVPDHAYHVVADRVGGRITYDVDGARILDWVDPHPLGNDRERIGIYSYDTDLWIDDVEVFRLGEPRSADILDVVERHLDQRQPIDADRLIDDVVASTGDGDRLARAQRARAKLERQRSQDDALARTRRVVLERWPGAEVTLVDGDVSVDLTSERPDDLADLAGLQIQRLVAPRGDLADLAPLAGMPLVELDIARTRVRSLAPLAGMRLRTLHADSCRIDDLAPLAGMPLEELQVSGNRIRDLAPLAGMPLRTLFIQRNQVRDLSPLARLPLARLVCGNNPVASLAPLAGLQQLTNLSLSGIGSIDLAPLAGLPLATLDMDDDGVSSLAPLAGLRLQLLMAAGNGISDLSPLAGMPLNRLDISDNPIASLEPLRGLPLNALDIRDLPAVDLTPLAGLALDTIGISRTPFADLRAFAGMPLRRLECAGTAVSDLAPLAGKRLSVLDISDTRVTSLAPLAGMPIELLRCDGAPVADLAPLGDDAQLSDLTMCRTAIRDLSPLAHDRLTLLACDGSPIEDLAPLTVSPPGLILADPAMPGAAALAAAWTRAFVRAGRAARDSWSSLAPMGGTSRTRVVGGRRYVLLSFGLTLRDAEAAAHAAGGRLVTLARPSAAAVVDDLVGGGPAWVGATVADGAAAWCSGELPAPQAPATTPDGRPARGYAAIADGDARTVRPVTATTCEKNALSVIIEWDD